jgi:hypothetical protein
MENLIFKHKGQAVSRKIMAGLMIIIAIFKFIMEIESLKFFDWVFTFFFLLVGIIYFTPLSGSDKSCIQSAEGNLKIRWRNWYREVLIPDIEIEKITLTRFFVKISRKGEKPVRMDIDFLEKEQKTKVYELLIEYAKERNLVLEK